MSYKVLRISRYYPDSIKQVYAQQPALAQQDYQTQLDALLWQCMTAGDAYTAAFRELGYDGQEIIANAAPLQRRWAEENGLETTGDDGLPAILRAQIRQANPDILLVFGGAATLSRDALQYVRTECPALKLAVVFTDAPTDDFSIFYEYDLVISNTPELVTHYREAGLPVHHLHYGFDARVISRIDTQHMPHIDLGFIGSIIMLDGYHQSRAEFLAAMVRETNLQIWSSAPSLSRAQHYKGLLQQTAYDTVQLVKRAGVPLDILKKIPLVQKVARWQQRPRLTSGIDWRLARRVQPPVYGLDMFQLMHDTRITINNHIDVSARSATNMRLFEATGVGSCLLTDWKDDLSQMYDIDTEVVTYRSAEEAIEKAVYLLDNPPVRQRIAEAGQQRTLRDHTYEQRVAQLDVWFREKLG